MSSPLLARSGLSLDRLASFIAIADAGGLSAAAQGDPVRQSQLSRQLKELEEFFGGTLIERRRGLFRLTATGRELSEIAWTTLTRLDDFERRCAGNPVEVHLGAGESVLVWMLLPRLGELLASEPAVVLTLHNLQSEEILRRLRDGRLDFGILRRTPVQAGLKIVALKPVEYALFAPRNPVSKRQPTDPKDLLRKVPLALLEGTGELNQALADWAEANGVALQTRLRCTSLLQAAEAVKWLGMAALLPAWAESAFTAGSVTRLQLPALQSLRASLQLVWSKRQGAVRTFLARIAKAISTSLTR
jgi:DNA-binding transcriptional LysR family regulator